MSPMILDNLGIQVSLEEATAEAAKMFGVEADALTKVQLQAGMMNVVMRALERNTAAMPEIAGTAAQRWAALGVTFKNVKDTIGSAFIPILERVMDVVKGLTDTYLPPLVDWFTNKLAPGIGEAFDRVSQFITDLSSGERLTTATRKLMQGIFDPDLIQKVIDVELWVQKIGRAIGAGDWSTAGAMLWEQVTIAVGKAIAVGDSLDTMLRDWASGKLGIKKELVIEPGMEGLPSDVLAAMEPNTSTWGEIGIAVRDQLIVQFGIAKEYLADWLAKGINFGTRIYEGMKQGLLDALNVAPMFEMNEMGEWVDVPPGGAIGKAIAAKLGADIVAGLSWWMDTTTKGIPEAFRDWATANLEKFTDAGNKIGFALATKIKEGISNSISYNTNPSYADGIVTEIAKATTQAALNMATTLRAIGHAIVDGIGEGIGEALGLDSPFVAGVTAALTTAWDTIMGMTPWGWYFRYQSAKEGIGGLGGIPALGDLEFGRKALGGYASGLTLVGERGPELVSLPRGSYVHDNAESERMVGGTTVNFGAGSIVVNNPRNASDVEIGVLRGLRSAGVAI
jgi:hypothetical protein